MPGGAAANPSDRTFHSGTGDGEGFRAGTSTGCSADNGVGVGACVGIDTDDVGVLF